MPQNLMVGTPIDTAKVEANTNIKIWLAILGLMFISTTISAAQRFKAEPWIVAFPVFALIIIAVFARAYKTGELQFNKQSNRMKADMATAMVVKSSYESSFTELGAVSTESAGYPGTSNVVLSTQTGAKVVLQTVPASRGADTQAIWTTYIESLKNLSRAQAGGHL